MSRVLFRGCSPRHERSVFWPVSAPWLPSTSVSYVSLFHVRLLCTKVHVSGSGILAKRRSRMRPGIRRNISADCLSCFYLLRANERNGLGRKQKKGIRGLDGGKRRDAYALFFFFPWQTRTSALGLGRGITKDLSICQSLSTVSCLESEKTRASNAFHYAIAWGCQLVKGLDLVGWVGRCAN